MRLIAFVTLSAFVSYGLVLTIFPLFPLWIDEWLLVDNLKFKSPEQLWQVLDHTQQFPRVYLQVVKAFCAACDYSYTSLRLPAFITHCFGLTLLYRLSGRIFGASLPRFAWVLLYVSFNTSIHYFILMKQYTMEMALSLVGIWQFLEIINMERKQPANHTRLLLFLSFAICPFFSYTYPIVIAPVFLIIAVKALRTRKLPAAVAMPLLLGLISVSILYWTDVRHVLADKGMQDYWQDLMLTSFSPKTFFANIYPMFSNMGSGDLFGNMFGVIGGSAFLYSTYLVLRRGFSAENQASCLLQYCCLLIWVVIALFIAGKLPLGSFRLNAFTVPAIGFMMIKALADISVALLPRRIAAGVLLTMFLVSAGNVFATMAEVVSAQHLKEVRIFYASSRALRIARSLHLPVMVTPAIAYPYNGTTIADWVLRTNPDFIVLDPVPVYLLPVADSACSLARRIPGGLMTAIVLDGESITTITPQSCAP